MKLLTGFAATGLLADMAYRHEREGLLAALGTTAAQVLAAHGVTDGRAAWQTPDGWTYRTARLAGTATPATRAAITADLGRRPGIKAVVWAADR